MPRQFGVYVAPAWFLFGDAIYQPVGARTATCRVSLETSASVRHP